MEKKLSMQTKWLQAAKDLWDCVNRLPEAVEVHTHPWRRDSIRRLESYRDKYAGKRCFIIGNGPSLKNTDMAKLKGEFTFGMNRIFLMFPELGFKTSFLVSVNDLVIEQSQKEFKEVNIPMFLSWRSRKWIEPRDNLHYLYTTYTGKKFAKDATLIPYANLPATFPCLQLAYFMGFSQAILIGVDHSFTTKGKLNTTIVSAGDDPNHFHPKYFGKGFKWQLPDLNTSEVGYLLAKENYSRDGREVIDATVGGKLTIFPKVKFDTLFNE